MVFHFGLAEISLSCETISIRCGGILCNIRGCSWDPHRRKFIPETIICTNINFEPANAGVNTTLAQLRQTGCSTKVIMS